MHISSVSRKIWQLFASQLMTLFTTLRAFSNAHRNRLVPNKCASPKTGLKQGFTNFLAEGTRLAEGSDQPVDLQNEELSQMIPLLVQHQMDVDDDEPTPDLSHTHCSTRQLCARVEEEEAYFRGMFGCGLLYNVRER